ncbi:hypothetical protein GCM10010211_20260 [Streptomyces albospinus]|uniref:Uncharacterized protein n=1 Tax=Streptomyces albospinus TaxID=285515 RepID=A0ABQ2UV34_9ACTN|nr:hypothetical protein [Streptomyces albospinus]GGU55471.1 hypothetical protein GCM10010211_20260 [Streptomyces albospinus]
MPQPSRTSSSERRSLRLNDIAHMGAAQLQPLLQDSFRNLVTAAIADATGHLPRSSRKLLHGPHFRDNLVDALRWAEGEMQVACERMTWTGDPRAGRTGRQLQQIRTALAQARAEEADRRRTEHRASAGHQVDTDSAATARRWLRSAYPDRFEQLLAQEYASAQLEPRTERPGPADVFDAVEKGASEGYLFSTMTPAIRDLLAKSPLAFRNTVAADAREQDERNVALRHPLLLRRWRTALDELAEMTTPLAGATSPTLLGPLTTDLDAMPRQAAFAVLNARRFLVAVHQRTAENTRVARQYAQTITRREQDEPDHAAHRRVFGQALNRLADEQPASYDYIRHRLRPFETSPGQLDTSVLNADQRGALKRHVLAELAPAPAPPHLSTTPALPRPATPTVRPAAAR